MIFSLFHILLISIVRIWHSLGINPTPDNSQSDDKYSFFNNILEYIDEHSNEPLSVSELAEKSNMSYSNFARNFRKKCGRSCKKSILNISRFPRRMICCFLRTTASVILLPRLVLQIVVILLKPIKNIKELHQINSVNLVYNSSPLMWAADSSY